MEPKPGTLRDIFQRRGVLSRQENCEKDGMEISVVWVKGNCGGEMAHSLLFPDLYLDSSAEGLVN